MSILTNITLWIGFFCFVFWWINRTNRNKHFYKSLPGPPTIPLFGNALDFKSTKDVLTNLCNYTKNYGPILKAKIGPFRKFILVSDYKFLETILSSTKLIKKSDDYNFFHPWLGTGLLTSDGHKWKKHRRVLTPAFHFQILEQFLEVFESCGNKIVKIFESEVGKESIDIYPYVTLCTLDIICESIMGININAQDNSDSDYVRSVKNMCRIVIERSMSPLQMYDFLFPLTKNYYTQKKSLKILHKQTNEVIYARIKELENQKQLIMNGHDSKKKKPFLDLLLQTQIDGKPLTHEEIREEVDTFMFEGHDTTASAISFTLYCLANHPDVQQKAYQEQQIIFQDKETDTATYADLQNMKYLEKVIKESLRLYPSVPIYGRETNEEVQFDDNTYLPKGDTILIFAFGIHRDPKHFEEPETFNPERFENADGKFPYAYIPFSAGPRNCIGQKFAMLEMKSTISKILRKYELQPAFPHHEMELVAETILKSTNGIKISLKFR
jgi:cytochrome P450 family 4